jgi:solute carrier family 25 phosphate transporter 23/24/25/41
MLFGLAVYQVKKRFPDGRGAARVNMDGDLSVSFPKSTASNPNSSNATSSSNPKTPEEMANCRESEASLVDGHEDCGARQGSLVDHSDSSVQEGDEDTEDHMEFNRHVAWKFLLAGGVAGAGEMVPGKSDIID